MTWLDTMMVVPLAAIRRKDSQNCTRSWGSMPTVGSSRRRSSGRCTSAHASEQRVDLTLPHAQVHAVHGLEGAERFGYAFDVDRVGISHVPPPLRPWRGARPRPAA